MSKSTKHIPEILEHKYKVQLNFFLFFGVPARVMYGSFSTENTTPPQIRESRHFFNNHRLHSWNLHHSRITIIQGHRVILQDFSGFSINLREEFRKRHNHLGYMAVLNRSIAGSEFSKTIQDQNLRSEAYCFLCWIILAVWNDITNSASTTGWLSTLGICSRTVWPALVSNMMLTTCCKRLLALVKRPAGPSVMFIPDESFLLSIRPSREVNERSWDTFWTGIQSAFSSLTGSFLWSNASRRVGPLYQSYFVDRPTDYLHQC